MKKTVRLICLLLVSNVTALFSQLWTPLGSGTNGFSVTALAIDSAGGVYAGGDFFKAGGIRANGIARWNGSEWSVLGNGVDNAVHVIRFFDGKMYVGGDFVTAGDSAAKSIAYWDGGKWSTLGSGMFKSGAHTLATSVRDLVMYKGQLYAAGVFDYADGKPISNIARWNGKGWEAVGKGISGNWVNTLCVYKDELYAAGEFTGAGGSPAKNIARWNGERWSDVAGGTNALINDITAVNDTLYAGGAFTKAGATEAGHIAKWDGVQWLAMGSGTDKDVTVIEGYSGKLFIGGVFSKAGDVSANAIAAWNGTQWSALGEGVNGLVLSIAGDPVRNDVYLGGTFTTAGGTEANRVVKYSLLTGVAESGGHDIEVFPQPASEYLRINTRPEYADKMTIVVYDMQGNTVYSVKIAGDRINLSGAAIAAGVYMYRIHISEKRLAQGFLVLE